MSSWTLIFYVTIAVLIFLALPKRAKWWIADHWPDKSKEPLESQVKMNERWAMEGWQIPGQLAAKHCDACGREVKHLYPVDGKQLCILHASHVIWQGDVPKEKPARPAPDEWR